MVRVTKTPVFIYHDGPVEDGAILVIFAIIMTSFAYVYFLFHYNRHLEPLRRFIDIYLAILRDWFRYLDHFTDTLTKAWWRYMKPVYMLIAPMYASLAQIFRPLRNVATLLGSMLGPLLRPVQAAWTALKPALSPLVACWRYACMLMQKLYGVMGNLIFFATNNSVVHLCTEKLRQLGVTRVVHNVLHGGLDPFRAQFVVIRDLLIKSVKQIYFSVRFIITRIYVVVYHWRRERRLHRDEAQHEGEGEAHRMKSE